MSTQAILFDINETVLDLSALRPKFRHYMGSESHTDTWFAMLLHSSNVCLVTGINTNFRELALAALQSIAARLGKNLSHENYLDILSTFTSLPAHSDIKPALTILRKAGFKLAAFSNSSSELLKSQLSHSGLLAHFDDVISVESANTFKPSITAYNYAVERLALPPNNIRLVATHDWDTHGALSAGLKAAYINRLNVPYNPHYVKPDIAAGNMHDITKQIIER
ncbi:haloacid dehalogenase type II [Agarivorans litoreus]|uniref:haloacid dehalogenase type II n=1 Tax=Agarivorans litoreus TaxID=1510455 RepID=UPI001C7CDBBB|nr:haloacid dehalogenase type II [Agarivorans litoreus]